MLAAPQSNVAKIMEIFDLWDVPATVIGKVIKETVVKLRFNGEKVFEAYAQQRTPGAYRVFWYYGPERGMITIVAITPHP